MEEGNKYWLEEEKRRCKFYNREKDNIEHFIRECRVTKGQFEGLGNEVEERIKRIRDDSLGKEKELYGNYEKRK